MDLSPVWTVHERDVNAAVNIKAEGLSVLARGGRVEPKPAWQLGKARSSEAGRSLLRGGESHHRKVIGRRSMPDSMLVGVPGLHPPIGNRVVNCFLNEAMGFPATDPPMSH